MTVHRVLVTGGRDFADAARLNAALDAVHRKHAIEVLMHGGASGADTLADAWAISRNIPVFEIKADWEIGRQAGPLRNQLLITQGKPTAALAFPRANGEWGTGTMDMVTRLRAADVPVWLLEDQRHPECEPRPESEISAAERIDLIDGPRPIGGGGR